MCSSDCFLGCLAILFPPLAVWVKRGICSADSLINIALLCLGYLPGLIHAWYIIAKYPYENPYEFLEPESGRYPRVYYFPVPSPSPQPYHAPPPPAQHPHTPSPAPQQQHPGYGALQQNAAPGPHTPVRYSGYQQQTPGNEVVAAGPSAGQDSGLPSYAEVVEGDYKVQTQD